MTLMGRVQNGVVVFDNGDRLPDGTLVEIKPTSPAQDKPTPMPISKERREALLGLIGFCKMKNPPNDEEVERIVDEELMKKYG